MGFKIKKITYNKKGENVMKKMNNKGFSLVELIVVVLIMAIIAVALAPQVMKWVENSRKSNDISNYNAMIEAANIAGTSEAVLSALKSGSAKVTFSYTGTQVSKPALGSAMKLTLPDLEDIAIESKWTGASGNHTPDFTFYVQSTKEGVQVVKDHYPEKDYE